MLLTLTRVVLRKCNPSLPLHYSIAGNTGTDAEKRKVNRNKDVCVIPQYVDSI